MADEMRLASHTYFHDFATTPPVVCEYWIEGFFVVANALWILLVSLTFVLGNHILYHIFILILKMFYVFKLAVFNYRLFNQKK